MPSTPIDATLMLTASIDIKGMPEVAIPDPRKREQEYIDSLNYWVSEQPDLIRIVFVENSGWPLDRLRAAADAVNRHNKKLELISMAENDYPREMGKGYGEILMMDRAVDRSQLIHESRHVVKLTGRAIVTNLSKLLHKVERREFDFLCDLRDHPFYRWLHIKASSQWCDARLYAFTPPFYEQNFRGQYLNLDYRKNEFAEDMLFAVARRHMAGRADPSMKVSLVFQSSLVSSARPRTGERATPARMSVPNGPFAQRSGDFRRGFTFDRPIKTVGLSTAKSRW